MDDADFFDLNGRAIQCKSHGAKYHPGVYINPFHINRPLTTHAEGSGGCVGGPCKGKVTG